MQIKQFTSGFYGLYNGDILRDAALTEWDGKKGTQYPYDTKKETGYCNYYVNASGDVFYSVQGGGCGLWCSASDLNRHCHRLAQIASRR